MIITHISQLVYHNKIIGFCARNELIATADCVCPGQNFTYECSVVGGRFTVWRGTVVSAGCEVTLFHTEFGVPGATRGVCNNGAVVGYNIGVENNCYTSKLDILVSPGLNGRTVECIIDNVTTNTVIDTSTLFITTSKNAWLQHYNRNGHQLLYSTHFNTYVHCTCSTFSTSHQCSTC